MGCHQAFWGFPASITAFAPDKQRALNEDTRVSKPGGIVALNEGTWMKTPPSADLVTFIDRMMANAGFLTADEWVELFVNAWIKDITQHPSKLNMLKQRLNEMRGLEFADYLERFQAVGTLFSLLIKSSDFRKYAKELTPSRKIISDMFSYLGYGFYICKKAVK